MSIEYVEIRDANTDIIGIIDDAASIIWHSVYFGVGDFEIYTKLTPDSIALLRDNYYVTRPDRDDIGIVEKISTTYDQQKGVMIVASGRLAKSILDRRLIYNLSGNTNTATVLRGNVEAEVRKVVQNNAISCAFDSKRNIGILELGALANIEQRIVDDNGTAAQKQVSYENLLQYTDGVLEEYGLAARVVLDKERRKLQYIVYQGKDLSVDNTSGGIPVIFSQEFDNLSASTYLLDTTQEKNAALIGGEGEGLERFYSLLAGTEAGLQRREIWVDASSISKTYKADDETDQTYTDTEYTAMLVVQGKQTIASLVKVEAFDGTIDITNGNYVYGRDFTLGDIVTVQDNAIGKYANVRIREITEAQDENGYKIEAVYQ